MQQNRKHDLLHFFIFEANTKSQFTAICFETYFEFKTFINIIDKYTRMLHSLTSY